MFFKKIIRWEKAGMTLSLLLWAALSSSCTNPEKRQSTVILRLSHSLSGDPLTFDSAFFVNKAQNKFSVERLLYYLSDFNFKIRGSSNSVSMEDIAYIDGRDSDTFELRLETKVPGEVEAFSFILGLSPGRNTWENLPATQENINMKWPLHLGGGYHFLKLEGRYEITPDSLGSYTIHLGTSATPMNLDEILIEENVSGNISPDSALVLEMEMDVLQWMDSPNVYDLSEAIETMTSDSLKGVLIENGNKELFKLKSVYYE